MACKAVEYCPAASGGRRESCRCRPQVQLARRRAGRRMAEFSASNCTRTCALHLGLDGGREAALSIRMYRFMPQVWLARKRAG